MRRYKTNVVALADNFDSYFCNDSLRPARRGIKQLTWQKINNFTSSSPWKKNSWFYYFEGRKLKELSNFAGGGHPSTLPPSWVATRLFWANIHYVPPSSSFHSTFLPSCIFSPENDGTLWKMKTYARGIANILKRCALFWCLCGVNVIIQLVCYVLQQEYNGL
jgi:hypothetical protein